MKRILMAGAVACALSMAFTAPVIADEETKIENEVVAQEALPKPDELKIQDGTVEGHKKPMDVYLKALKAAKAGDAEALKTCFAPDSREYLDNLSYDNDENEEETTAQALVRVLKGYSEEALVRAQGKVGNYAVIAVKNGEAVNLVKVTREGKWNDDGTEGPKNWYLASNYVGEYRTDYNAPGLKSLRDAIEKGDIAKLKEHLNEWQTKALDLITGVEEGVDGYALLMKRLQKIVKSEAKPVFILSRYDSALAYWFHSEEGDTFLVVRFNGDMYDWETEKKYTQVQLELEDTSEFHKDAGQAFKDFVSDWDW